MKTTPKTRCIVFSDFDGTITVDETFRKVLYHFIPDVSARVIPALDRGALTLREGVIELVSALRSEWVDAMVRFIAREPLRPGFAEFATFLHDRHIPLVIVSSGLRFYVESRLRPWLAHIHAIHALEVDTSGTNMRLQLEHAHPSEAMPKEWVLRSYDAEQRIAIGDSLSDFEMVKAADLVFARDRLLARLQAEHRPVTPYGDFHDVLAAFPDEGATLGRNF